MGSISKLFDRYSYLKHSTAGPMKPAHLNTEHPPGQIRPSAEELKGQQTLSDYIRSINKAQALDDVAKETKLTFDEWYVQSGWQKTHDNILSLDDADSSKFIMQKAWIGALTKGKL